MADISIRPYLDGVARVVYRSEDTGVTVTVEVAGLARHPDRELEGKERYRTLWEAHRAAEAFVSQAADDLKLTILSAPPE